ncbi:hypothetical protein HD554DRAFT_2117590 [Boletus coccyginus]|nr:hypothetical protein HD554DRAFT_2117590 [Boletus coccyginus]
MANIQNADNALFANTPVPPGEPIVVNPAANPTWIFEQVGVNLFNIQNIASNFFAAIQDAPAAGAQVVTVPAPFVWEVVPQPIPGAVVTIRVPNTKLVWTISKAALPGAPITIEQEIVPIPPNQQWIV